MASVKRTCQKRFSHCLLAVLVACWAGCSSLPDLKRLADATDKNVSPEAANDAPVSPTVDKAAQPDAPTEPSAALAKQLAAGRWWPTPPAAGGKVAAHGWRHEQLEQALTTPDAALLRQVADGGDQYAAADAVIGLVRIGEAVPRERLLAVASDAQLETNRRCAAIEALGEIVEREGTADWELLAPLCDPTREGYDGGAHAEAFAVATELAIEIPPAAIVEAARATHVEPRKAAAQYCAARGKDLPIEVCDLRTDPDINTRKAALAAIAACAPEGAADMLAASLTDTDFGARLAATRALGQVDSDQARSLLRAQLKDSGELIRAAAVEALAASGAHEELLELATDRSWRVRKSVAASLAKTPSRDAQVLAAQLLKDQSPEVEVAVVEAVAQWPLDRGGEILLTACAHAALVTRQRAAERLTAIWPEAKLFSATAPVERRAEMIAELRAQLASAAPMAQLPDAGAKRGRGDSAVDAEEIQQTRELLERLALAKGADEQRAINDELASLGDARLPTLEAVANLSDSPLPEALYREVLPALDRRYELLARMQDGDQNERRRASSELAALAAVDEAGPLALRRLAEIMPRERDAVVWLNVWKIVGGNTSDPAMRLAYTGLAHTAAEVRREACDYLGSHPLPAHEPALAAALSDDSPDVARAAAQALGRCGPLTDMSPLLVALESNDPRLRLAAAISLTQLGEPAGGAALERYSQSDDAGIRLAVAQALGEMADPQFAAALARMLDDRESIRRAALLALEQTLADEIPYEPADAISRDERVARWKRRFAER